jgi:hypothetical protein
MIAYLKNDRFFAPPPPPLKPLNVPPAPVPVLPAPVGFGGNDVGGMTPASGCGFRVGGGNPGVCGGVHGGVSTGPGGKVSGHAPIGVSGGGGAAVGGDGVYVPVIVGTLDSPPPDHTVPLKNG